MAKKAGGKVVRKAAKKAAPKKPVRKVSLPAYKAASYATQHSVEQFLYKQAEVLDAKRCSTKFQLHGSMLHTAEDMRQLAVTDRADLHLDYITEQPFGRVEIPELHVDHRKVGS